MLVICRRHKIAKGGGDIPAPKQAKGNKNMDAKTFTQHAQGRWHRTYGTAPCPHCQPEHRRNQTALTIADGRNGRLLLDCKKSQCAFVDILAALGLSNHDYTPPSPIELHSRHMMAKTEAQQRAHKAREAWETAQPRVT